MEQRNYTLLQSIKEFTNNYCKHKKNEYLTNAYMKHISNPVPGLVRCDYNEQYL